MLARAMGMGAREALAPPLEEEGVVAKFHMYSALSLWEFPASMDGLSYVIHTPFLVYWCTSYSRTR